MVNNSVVIAEMFYRQFIFAGETDLETLTRIIEICGTPVCFPPTEWDTLPEIRSIGVRVGNLPNKFATLIPK